MRRLVIAILSLIEAAIGCGIFAESVVLSHAAARNETIGKVACVVLRSTREIAFDVKVGLRKLEA